MVQIRFYNKHTLVTALDKMGGVIGKATCALCAGLLVIMLSAVLVGVFFRYVLENPLMWTDEIARFSLVWVSYLAINVAWRRREHVSVKFLTQKLSPRLQVAMEIAIHVLIAGFLIILFIKGWRMTMRTQLTALTFRLSMSWIYISVPIAALLTLIQLFLNAVVRVLSGNYPEAEDLS